MDEQDDFDIRYHSYLAKFSDLIQSKYGNQLDNGNATTGNLRSVHGSFPLEFYLDVDENDRKSSFYKSIKSYDVFMGEVVMIIDNQMKIELDVLLTGQKRWIRDLRIEAWGEKKTDESSCNEIDVGDKVKGVITYIDRDSKQLKVTFDEKLLLQEYMDLFPLGKLDEDELEQLQSLLPERNRCDHFDEDLKASQSFIDPHCISKLVKHLHVDPVNASFLPQRVLRTFKDSIESLRDVQSSNCSMQLVSAGVQLFRQQKYKEAITHFEQAISLYPKNVEAYVARGALRANKNNLKEALQDFRAALSINSEHKNGKKYFIETSMSLAKSHEKEMRWKESSKCYKEILKYDESNMEATERYKQVRLIISNKVSVNSSTLSIIQKKS